MSLTESAPAIDSNAMAVTLRVLASLRKFDPEDPDCGSMRRSMQRRAKYLLLIQVY